MKISELREWATEKFGAHSHQEGQILAALGPLEESFGQLARYGIMVDLMPPPEPIAPEALPEAPSDQTQKE